MLGMSICALSASLGDIWDLLPCGKIGNRASWVSLVGKVGIEHSPGAKRINLSYNKLESGFVVDIAYNAVLSACFG
jgi:hypothetical protein